MISYSKQNNYLIENKNYTLISSNYFFFIIYGTLVSIFFLDFFNGYLNLIPRQITWAAEIFSLILFMLIFADLAFYKLPIKFNFLTYFLIVWLFISVIGVVINNVKPFVYFAGVRNYFKFIPFFIALSIYPLPLKLIEKFFEILILISASQLLFVIPEKVIFWGKSGDLIVGTLGQNASGTLVIFQLLSFSIIISLYKCGYYTTKKFLLYSIPILLSTFITEGKIVFFILPFIFIISFLGVKNLPKIIIIFFMGFIFIIIGVFLYNFIYGNIERHFINYDSTLETLGANDISYAKNDRLRRISQVRFMFKNINHSTYSKIFGYGIGNASDSYFKLSKGEYSKRFPSLGIDKVLLSRLGWEFGYSGIFIFFFFLIFLYNYRIPNTNIEFYNGILEARKGIIIVILFSCIYNSSLIINPISFVFWSYLGIFNNIILEHESQNI